MPTPIPALIVSGFLGSGKTTVVRHLLKQAQAEGARLAIISNEFGDVGIDKALLDQGQEGLVELDGGCVCCRLSDALGETLEMLLTQIKPDRLVLETSGIAQPGEILVQFWRPPIDELISEEVVVVCVDGERLLREPRQNQTFLDQVQAADLILLTECDLLEEASIVGAEARLAQWTDGQPVLRVVDGVVEPGVLFPPDPEKLRAKRRDPDAEGNGHHHDQYTTVELNFPTVTTEAEVVATVLGVGTLRVKGFFQTRDGIRMIQCVGPRTEISEPPVTIPPELVGKVVVIRKV